MRVAIRCIYHKAVTPSCDIVYMNNETWDRFRFGNRKQIALELLGKEDMSPIQYNMYKSLVLPPQ